MLHQPAAATTRIVARISPEPLSVDALVDIVRDRSAGALALFLGVVRDHDAGHQVASLDYTQHPSAATELTRVTHEIAGRHAVIALATEHRVGRLEVGDLAVVVAASAVHRAAALEACRDLIDTLKAEVPIWKEQRLADGATEWVGLS